MIKMQSVSVIPPNIPSARRGQTGSVSFGKKNNEIEELQAQKGEMDKLANDKKNPLGGILKAMGIATGAVITGLAMKATLNTSIETLNKASQSERALQYIEKGKKVFAKVKEFALKIWNKIKDFAIIQFKKIKGTKAGQSIGRNLNKYSTVFKNSKVGAWVSAQTANIQVAGGELAKEIKNHIPTIQNVKSAAVNTISVAAGGATVIKGADVVNHKKHAAVEEHEYEEVY